MTQTHATPPAVDRHSDRDTGPSAGRGDLLPTVPEIQPGQPATAPDARTAEKQQEDRPSSHEDRHDRTAAVSVMQDRAGHDRSTDTDTAARASGRTSAWIAFALGIAVSVAANVAHAWYPTPTGPTDKQLAQWLKMSAEHTRENWHPSVGAQAAAAFYPLALLLTIEMVTRIRWPQGWSWVIARYGGVGVVAAVAAVVSYRHMRALLEAYGEDELTAILGPLAVDGLMVVASVALLATSAARLVQDRQPVQTTASTTPATGDQSAVSAVIAPSMFSTPDVPEQRTGQDRPEDRPDRPTTDLHTQGSGPVPPAGNEEGVRVRVAQLLEKDPGLSGAAIAAELGVSDGYGRKLRRQIRPTVLHRRANGTTADQETTTNQAHGREVS